jgi:fucose 4-O-acetylase-like acetyltransferase
MEHTRNHAFDFLCGICIIRMVMLHITGNVGLEDEPWWTAVMEWTYYFMSFFFFKAGYFNKTMSGDSWSYVKDKARRLLIPYIVWGTIGNVIFFFFAWLILPSDNAMVKGLEWSHVWMTGKFFGNAPCWFLLSFFCAYVAMHFMSRVRGLRWVAVGFPFVSWWLAELGNPLWLGLGNVFFGIFLFFLGRVWRWMMQRMRRRWSLLVSVLLLAVFAWMNVAHHSEHSMADNLWTGSPLVVVASTIASLCGLSGLLLNIRIPRVPLVNYIGQHSMVFFVCHMPLIIFYRMVRSAAVHSLTRHWDDYVLLIFICFGFCLLLVPHVERVPWLSGRFKPSAHTKPDAPQPSA